MAPRGSCCTAGAKRATPHPPRTYRRCRRRGPPILRVWNDGDGMTILDRILATKRDEVAAAKREHPWSTLESTAREAEPPRGLRAALARPPGTPVRVLAEI